MSGSTMSWQKYREAALLPMVRSRGSPVWPGKLVSSATPFTRCPQAGRFRGIAS